MNVLNNYFHLFSYIDKHFVNLTVFLKDNKIENFICYCYKYIANDEHNILSIDDRLIIITFYDNIYDNKIIDNRQSNIKSDYIFIIYFENVCIKISNPNHIHFLPNADTFGSYKIDINENLKEITNNIYNLDFLSNILKNENIIIKEYIRENPNVYFYIFYNDIYYFVTPNYSGFAKFKIYIIHTTTCLNKKKICNNINDVVCFLDQYIPNLQDYYVKYNKIENNTYNANKLYEANIDFNKIYIARNIKNIYIIPIIRTPFLHTIYFDDNFNEFINKDVLPDNIHTIVFGYNYNQPTYHLPINLKNLIFKGNMSKQVILPNDYVNVIFKKKVEI